MHLRPKFTEICQKVISLDKITEQNRFKVPIIFFKKPTAFVKNKKHYSIFFIVKISVSTNFICLRQKGSSEMYWKLMRLYLRTALKCKISGNKIQNFSIIIFNKR